MCPGSPSSRMVALRVQQAHEAYRRVRETRAAARNQIQRARHFHLADADFGKEFAFHFPADAHARDNGHAHAHLHEALDAFRSGALSGCDAAANSYFVSA